MTIVQTWISLVSASTALIASVAGQFVTLRVGRQQFKANVLSVNRQRCIETVRDAAANLTARLQSAAALKQMIELPNRAALASDARLLTRIEDLRRTIAKIELLLNSNEGDHRRLRDLMRTAVLWLAAETVRPDLLDEMDSLSDEIVGVAHVILERKWTRVKRGT